MPPPDLAGDASSRAGSPSRAGSASPSAGGRSAPARRARPRWPAPPGGAPSRTTAPTGRARPPCRSGSSAPRRGSAPRLRRSAPASARASLTAVRASKRSRPAKGPPAAVTTASSSRTVMAGRPGPRRDLEVGGVVRRGHLHRPGAEGGVDRRVADDGDLPAHQRQAQGAPDQPPVALVVGVHRHRGVAEHGLRPGGGHLDAAPRRRRRGTRCRPVPRSGPRAPPRCR